MATKQKIKTQRKPAAKNKPVAYTAKQITQAALKHETDLYGKRGEFATKHICNVHDLIYLHVQAGSPKTVAAAMAACRDATWAATHIGYRVNAGNWAINGVTPNSKSGQLDSAANASLGVSIVKNHGAKLINVVRPATCRTRAVKA